MNNLENPNTLPEADESMELPDTYRFEQARSRLMHNYSLELLIKKTIWWVCIGGEVIAIVGSMIFMFSTQSLPLRLLCVVIALIGHEGMVVVALWSIMTALRMDMLRELKSMELQLAELRVGKKTFSACTEN